MDNKFFMPLVIVCIATHIIRSIYEILKYKKRLNPGKLSFAIIFTNMAILWVSWFGLCSLDPYRISLAGMLRYSGLFLVITGLAAFLTALVTIKTLESYEGELITTGIYSKIRHPMYLGFIFWCIGFPVFQGALFSIFLSLLFITNILFWRHLEEIELEKRFIDYAKYRKTTLF